MSGLLQCCCCLNLHQCLWRSEWGNADASQCWARLSQILRQNRCDILKKFSKFTLNVNANVKQILNRASRCIQTMVRFVSAFESCPRQYGLKLGGSCPSQPDQKCRQYSQYQQRHGTIRAVSIITLWWINQLLSWSNPYMKGSKDPKFTEFQCLISFRFLWCFVKFFGRSIVA